MRSPASSPVRSVGLALAVLVGLLAGCVSPQGGPLEECPADWEPVIVVGPSHITGPGRTRSIDCYRVVGERRIEVGFTMPPGPECFAVDFIEVIEDSEAVALELRIGPARNPLGGACPEEELLWAVPVELNGPAEGRRILDISVPPN